MYHFYILNQNIEAEELHLVVCIDIKNHFLKTTKTEISDLFSFGNLSELLYVILIEYFLLL